MCAASPRRLPASTAAPAGGSPRCCRRQAAVARDGRRSSAWSTPGPCRTSRPGSASTSRSDCRTGSGGGRRTRRPGRCWRAGGGAVCSPSRCERCSGARRTTRHVPSRAPSAGEACPDRPRASSPRSPRSTRCSPRRCRSGSPRCIPRSPSRCSIALTEPRTRCRRRRRPRGGAGVSTSPAGAPRRGGTSTWCVSWRPPRDRRADDALACAWSALRWARGQAVELGDPRARDARGLRMTIRA